MRDLAIIETKDKYIKERKRRNNSHKKSRFQLEIYPGIVAEFGEPKSKLRSKRYQLLQLTFSKSYYDFEKVEGFLRNFHVKYIRYNHNGQKVAPIFRVLGSPKQLIHGGYIVICKNTSSIKKSIKTQISYEFWKQHFYDKGSLSTDEETLNKAIPLLIDKIHNTPRVLHDMPYPDHRVFEELVAEIFKGFGYSVELTKRTRDGGKDIIALKKENNSVKEKILIECKHWSNKVDVIPIRNLLGVAISQDELPTGVILATTNKFTLDAQKIRVHGTIKIELERKDYDDIIEWIEQYDAIQLSKIELNRYFDSLLNV